ncbi:hypothetical protein B0T22DRAFT_10712 [Podospora appendiculata]|uniref:Secreted protein n=1 Tax=Podospora appendiculata TaxID=314037 RepID=A0AAE0XF54_9PEZI|nr:hypothetical protein B0T22DRAFT_10712 [Podospora appendiculata]
MEASGRVAVVLVLIINRVAKSSTLGWTGRPLDTLDLQIPIESRWSYHFSPFFLSGRLVSSPPKESIHSFNGSRSFVRQHGRFLWPEPTPGQEQTKSTRKGPEFTSPRSSPACPIRRLSPFSQSVESKRPIAWP